MEVVPEYIHTEITKAGIIPYYQSQFVVIKSTGKGKFVFPKGGIKPSESAQCAAMREAHEEAGIKGTITRDIGVIDGTRWFFVVVDHLDSEYCEVKYRQRKLLSYKGIFEESENVSSRTKSIVSYIKNKLNII